MNPLDWRGPEFLAFYATFAAAMLIAQYAFRRLREDTDSPPPQLTDPYEIAYLRGGENELIRVAIVNLLEQHRLSQVGEDRLVAVPSDVTNPNRIEQGILKYFKNPSKPHEIFTRKHDLSNVMAAIADIKDSLTQRGLLVGPAESSARTRDTLIVIGILVGIAGAKVMLALERGKSNVGFLVLLAIVSVIVSLVLTAGRITPLGRNALDFLREAFHGVQAKAKSFYEVSPAEVALMAAVFGMPMLAETTHPQMKKLFPGATGGSSSSNCGSGCGSGSSCGSGDGGGGCGGCGGGGD